MKRFLTCLLILFTPIESFADTLQLLDGRTVSGTIVEQNERQIVIRDEKGRLNRYYKDQVTQVITGAPEVALTANAAEFENISLEKTALILQLLEANGTRRNLQANISAALTKAPADKKEELRKLFDLNEIIAELVPVYDRHFTQEDLEGMIAFYESGAGQKMLSVSSALIKEVTQTTMGYFQKKLSPTGQ